MKKNNILIVLIVIFCLFLFVACDAPDSTETTSTDPASQNTPSDNGNESDPDNSAEADSTETGDEHSGNGDSGDNGANSDNNDGSEETDTGGSGDTDPGVDPCDNNPYNGLAAAVPGRIEAENYDTGCNDTAYFDIDAENTGGQYRNDAVDIEVAYDSESGYSIGWLRDGEWLNYSINVAEAGLYDIAFRYAGNGSSGSEMHLSIDGSDITGAVNISPTGGWQNWRTDIISDVTIPEGLHTLTLHVDTGDFNVNWFHISSADNADNNDDAPGDEIKQSNLTWYTSYPEPGSDECILYNGCTWAGYFAGIDGQMTENWVATHNIAAVHEKDFETYRGKTLRITQGDHTIDAVVYDMCSDSDCNGCCTENAGSLGFLIDLESYTAERFGVNSGVVDWTCIDCDDNSGTDSTEDYNVYFGDLHNHSCYSEDAHSSNCADVGTSFQMAKASATADFVAVTDHGEYLDETKWADMKVQADAYTDGSFVSIAAFEFAVAGSSAYDDMSTYLTDYTNDMHGMEYSSDYIDYLDYLIADKPEGFATFTHPGRSDVNGFNDFGGRTKDRDARISMLEILNSNNSPCEADYQEALDMGWHVAPVQGGDVHSREWLTTYDYRTGCLATSLTRDNLLDAMKQRRCYATQLKDLKIKYTLNGSIMGRVISPASSYAINVQLETASANISKIEVIGNGGRVVAVKTTNDASLVYEATLTPDSDISYLYVRVTTSGGLAWTAPVWIDGILQ